MKARRIVSLLQLFSTVLSEKYKLMHSFANVQGLSSTVHVYFLLSYDKGYRKQEVCLLLYFLGQIVTW